MEAVGCVVVATSAWLGGPTIVRRPAHHGGAWNFDVPNDNYDNYDNYDDDYEQWMHEQVADSFREHEQFIGSQRVKSRYMKAFDTKNKYWAPGQYGRRPVPGPRLGALPQTYNLAPGQRLQNKKYGQHLDHETGINNSVKGNLWTLDSDDNN